MKFLIIWLNKPFEMSLEHRDLGAKKEYRRWLCMKPFFIHKCIHKQTDTHTQIDTHTVMRRKNIIQLFQLLEQNIDL